MRTFYSLIIYPLIGLSIINANTIKSLISPDYIINNIQNELGYFRINCNSRYTKVTQTNQNSSTYIPSIVTIDCETPVGREKQFYHAL